LLSIYIVYGERVLVVVDFFYVQIDCGHTQHIKYKKAGRFEVQINNN